MSIVCPKNFAIFQNRGEGRALSPYFSSANDVFSLRPDGDDVVPVHHVDRALEALAHRERVRGFGEVGVVDDNGVEIVAGDKAAVPAEILVSCAGAEVVALLDGQKFVLSVGLHVAELRRADGHGDDLVHRQQRAARDVGPERDEVALAQQRPHGC